MNTRLFAGLAGTICMAMTIQPATAQTPLSTTFTYQGRLNVSGSPGNGPVDFQFRLYDTLSGGALVGAQQAASNVGMADGLFTVTLDFGAGAFNGEARWLEIDVRSPAGSGAFTTLSPRQILSATPYALYALSGPGSGGPWTINGNNVYNTNTGHVGIGDSTPAATLTIGNGDKVQFSGVQGDVLFTDDLASITFPACDATNSPMMQMFASGTGNGDRMVLAHSPGFPTWGLEYEDAVDRFNFLSSGSPVLTVDLATQRVGVGMSSPTVRLDVNGAVRASGAINAGPDGVGSVNGSRIVALATSGTFNDLASYAAPLTINHVSPQNVFLCMGGGNVGVGTTAPIAALHVKREAIPPGGTLALEGTTHTYMSFFPDGVAAGRKAFFGFPSAASSSLSLFNEIPGGNIVLTPGAGGVVSVPVLEITGADLAEKFATTEEVEPGMVVAIDPLNAGKLCLARGAYNRCVAGVVSGANSFAVGAVLGNLPGHEDASPVALSGRVYVWCDASNGAIEPGNLLTTADTPGHAMNATDRERSHGAVIGKAMTALPRGEKGLVLTLVNLQ